MQISFHSTKYNYQWSVKQDDIFPPYFSQIHKTSHHLVTNSNFCSMNFPSSALADPEEVVCEGSWATSHKICRFKSCLIWHNNSCNDRIPSYYSTGWFLFPWYCRQQLVIAYLDVKHTLALYCKPEALTSVHTLNTWWKKLTLWDVACNLKIMKGGGMGPSIRKFLQKKRRTRCFPN